jgi:hypothetical protein
VIDLYHGLYRAEPVNLTEEAEALMADLREQAATILDPKEIAE